MGRIAHCPEPGRTAQLLRCGSGNARRLCSIQRRQDVDLFFSSNKHIDRKNTSVAIAKTRCLTQGYSPTHRLDWPVGSCHLSPGSSLPHRCCSSDGPCCHWRNTTKKQRHTDGDDAPTSSRSHPWANFGSLHLWLTPEATTIRTLSHKWATTRRTSDGGRAPTTQAAAFHSTYSNVKRFLIQP